MREADRNLLRPVAASGLIASALSAMVGIEMHDGKLFGVAILLAAICAAVREVTK